VFTRRLISLEQAIRKMTTLPAAQAGIRNRGVLKPGYFADFVVFEPENLDTSSTFLDPAHFPSGIKYVSVNGKIVLRPEGYFPTPLSGRFLRKNQ
jgi:N-acyl-D-aspartate/D-glutamate deacylase